MTRLEQLELQSLTRWVDANLNSNQALQRAIKCEELQDYPTAEKFLKYAALKEKEERNHGL